MARSWKGYLIVQNEADDGDPSFSCRIQQVAMSIFFAEKIGFVRKSGGPYICKFELVVNSLIIFLCNPDYANESDTSPTFKVELILIQQCSLITQMSCLT